MICLANDFEPSIMAASRPGPKQANPASRSASARPATSGASGPITTRSAPVFAASAVTLAGSAGAAGGGPAPAGSQGEDAHGGEPTGRGRCGTLRGGDRRDPAALAGPQVGDGDRGEAALGGGHPEPVIDRHDVGRMAAAAEAAAREPDRDP